MRDETTGETSDEATGKTIGIAHVSTASETTADLIWVCRSASLPRAEYRFYRALLLTFPECGGPPDRATLRRLARRFGVGLESTLAQLVSQDLVQRDPTTGAITVAYPFSGVPTSHRVVLAPDPEGRSPSLFAMCALDALGIPLMLRRTALVASMDPLTGEAVRVRIWQDDATAVGVESGLPGWRVEWEPITAVVYARPEDHTADPSDIAAACRCPVTNFFTAPDHAHRWAEQHGTPGDIMLAHADALQRADRRFGGMVDRLTRDGADEA